MVCTRSVRPAPAASAGCLLAILSTIVFLIHSAFLLKLS